MPKLMSRARTCALLALLVYSPLAATQTMELITGGQRFVDVPGTSLNSSPNSLAIGPDGALYVADNGRLVRVNIALGTATALPATPGGLNVAVGQAIAFDASGQLFTSVLGTLQRIDIETGATTNLGTVPSIDEMFFVSDGTLYFANTYEHQIGKRLPSGEVVIIAGVGGESGFDGDGGPAVDARLAWPQGLVMGPDGDLYFADQGNARIRKISLTTGIISTVAGTGEYGYNGDGLTALATNFSSPTSLLFDSAGNLLVADWGAYRLRRIDAVSGLVSTIAGYGMYGEGGAIGDGGPALLARITFPRHLTLDAGGNLFFADSNNSTQNVRKIAAGTGIITRVLGNDTYYFCGEGVPASFACFGEARGLDVDAAGNLLVADGANSRVRKISAGSGLISTLSNITNASPFGVEHDAAGNIYVTSWGPYTVYRINAVTGVRTVFAGNGSYGFSGDGGPATNAMVGTPSDVAIDAAGNVFIPDSANHRIRRVDAATGIITTYAGFNFSCGWSGDGGPATAARLCGPTNLEFDPAGNLVFADGQGCRLRKIIKATGIISTIAGNATCTQANPGDGGLATATSIGVRPAFAFDPAGNIFISWSNKIRRIDAVTGIISSTPAPAGGLATPEGKTFTQAAFMEFDAAGRLYLTDMYRPYVFRISGLLDSTPPVITPNIVGTAGNGGWYRSNVQISWTVNDPESTVSSSSGCTSSSVTADTAGVTFTCTATSIGGSASQSVTIRRDTVAPDLTFGAASPAADASGWNSSDVSVSFNATDALSGVYSTSNASPLSITAEGSGVTAQVVVTDFAGNSASFTTPAFNIDKSPPVIGQEVSGTFGMNGWYKTDVQIHWSVSEPQSAVTSSTGCDSTSVTTDTAGVTYTCTAISAGGTSTQSITVKRDATLPVLTWGAPVPAANASGWNTTDVSIPFTVDDATSGIYSVTHPSPTMILGDGPGLTAQEVVTDNAGNSATFTTPVVNIDRLPPSVQPTVSGTLGNNGWYKSDVQVSWAINESPASIISTNGCGIGNVTADTSGVTFTCSVISGGGTASSSVTIKRDATPPVLNFGTPSPAPNANGWNKTNVSISFTRSDALSGLASTSATSPLAFNTEGAASTRQVTVTDLAGNTATFTTVPVNIDKTAPYAEIQVPEDTATYGFYSDLVAQYECVDTSLASCTGPSAIGGLISTTTAGARTFKITAKDQVGFTTTHTHAFTIASTFNFDGFLAPVRVPSTLNLVTHGALVPIRWRLPDGNGGFVSNTASFTSATVATLTCGSTTAVPLNDTAIGPAGISFDAGTSTFIYNWQTDPSWTGCRKLTIKLKDNSTHELRFKFQ